MKRGLTVAAAMLALTGCSSGYEPDMSDIESQLQTGLKDNQLNATVDCPDQIDWNTGNDFHCIATDKQGRTARVTVTMESDDGAYTWTLG
jgi:hypothetical protein